MFAAAARNVTVRLIPSAPAAHSRDDLDGLGTEGHLGPDGMISVEAWTGERANVRLCPA